MNKFQLHILKQWKHLENSIIFVACSGGVDSITLLHILKSLNWNIEAIHVNYGLRELDSDLDQELVEKTCRDLNIPLHITKSQLKNKLENEGGNLQDEARKERYAIFHKMISLSPNNYIALAHHQDDQIETFFLNLSRKSGIMGLACMPEEHHHIIRPFLPFSKEEIKEFAIKNHINWREDKSNSSNKYKRNLLRNRILPELYKEIPSLKESVIVLIKQFQKKQLEIEYSIKNTVQEIHKDQFLSIKEFNKLNDEQLFEIFRQLEIEFNLVPEWKKLSLSETGKYFKIKNEQSEYSIIYKERDGFSFELRNELSVIPTLKIEKVESLPLTFSKFEIYLDGDKLDGQLNIRPWKKGDFIHPIGVNGKTFISDILKDSKIRIIDKKNQFVIHDNKHIYWLVNLKVGSKNIASPETKNILKISIEV